MDGGNTGRVEIALTTSDPSVSLRQPLLSGRRDAEKSARFIHRVIEEDRSHLLNPGLLLDRRIRRDGDSSCGPLLVLVKNGDFGILVSRRQDQLALYLQSEKTAVIRLTEIISANDIMR